MNKKNQISPAITALKAGDLIGYPTESVYGFGADPFNEKAIAKLQQLKTRPTESAFLMIASNFEQVKQYIGYKDPDILKKITITTERPTTWVCPASELVPDFLWGPNKTIALRITTFPLCLELCNAFNSPIISTSANFKGQAPAKTYQDMQKFSDKLSYIIDAPCGEATRPSTIIDLISDRVYRA